MKTYDTLDLINPPPDAVLGNHSIWLPEVCVKVPFQFGGRITKRTRHEDVYPKETIVDEVCILRALAEKQMAPPVSDLVFIREVISDYPGAWHSDPCGAYGFEMADATKLPPGKFDIDAMKALPIDGSDGAWGDVIKEKNIINGYLVDVRRTGWDLLRWHGERFQLPNAREDQDYVISRTHHECQFPANERLHAYQDFWARNELQTGQRRVLERAAALNFHPSPGESVLDIGTQSGSFLQHAWLCTNGNGRFVGVDVDDAYIMCAKLLARSCNQNICFRHMDVTREREAFLSWIRAYFPDGVDHLLLLSMEKHIGERSMFKLIDEIGARHTYIETNAVAEDLGSGIKPPAPLKLWPDVQLRGGEHVGDSRDRNLRRLYRIDQ